MPTKHYPFRKKRKIGPGPKGQTLERADRWSCDCETVGHIQTCECKGVKTKTGRPSKARKTVRNDLRKKKKYRKAYKAWKKRQKGR